MQKAFPSRTPDKIRYTLSLTFAFFLVYQMILPADYSLIALYCLLIKDIQMQILNEIKNYVIITIP